MVKDFISPDDSNFDTTLFKKEEIIGYRYENHIIFLSASNLLIEQIINFPFHIRFFSYPDNDGFIVINISDRPNDLILWNISENKEEAHISFEQEVLQLSFSGIFLLAITQNAIYVMRTNPLIIQYTSKTQSPILISCINSSPEDPTHALLAFSDIRDGYLVIRKVPSTESDIIIEAHKSPLAAITISEDNTKIATASQQGTLIRLWNSDGTPFQENRRGFTTADIINLNFSASPRYICVTSSHMTTHIFDLEEKDPSYFQKADVRVSIPHSSRVSCSLLKNNQNLLVVTGNGECYIYNIVLSSGESTLMTQLSLSKIVKSILPK